MNELEHERLDVYQAAIQFLALSAGETTQNGRAILLRIVAMLTAMVVKLSGSGSGSG